MAKPQKIDKAQALAGVRVLVHLVWADGAVSADEQAALKPCLNALGLEGAAADEFLSEDVQLTEALEAVTHPKLRRAVMRAAHAIAHADEVRTEETSVIEKAQRAWGADVEDEKLMKDVERLGHEDEMPRLADPGEQAAHLSRLMASWTLAIADLALSPDEVEARWRGRKTDIGELTRRLVRGEATPAEVAFKFKEDIGET